MRVNIYAEEMTDRLEIIEKVIEGQTFTALRFYLELPVTIPNPHGGHAIYRGPFIHHPGDDDSAAVTFWGKEDLRIVLRKALAKLDEHYAENPVEAGVRILLRTAVSLALPLLVGERDIIVECSTLALPDGTPDLSTLEAGVAEIVAEYDRAIDMCTVALVGEGIES